MPFNNKAKKYWIVPQESLGPEDLQLGHILKRPNDPIGLLNRRAVEGIDPAYVISEREQVSKSLNDAISNGFGFDIEVSSILAAVIGASPRVGAGWSKTNGNSIEATRVRAQHFSPPDEYVNKALSTTQVADYVRKSFFTAPVYMVVGVTVASSLVRAVNKSRNMELKGGAGLGPPGTGAELSAELSGNRGKESHYSDSVEGDVVLAYRLRRFRYSKIRGRITRGKQDVTAHARYSHDSANQDDADQDSTDEEDEIDYLPVFSYFEDHDITAMDASTQGFVEAEENGENEESD